MRTFITRTLTVLLLLPAAAPASAAGAMAVTCLDPVPASFTPGTSHTIGFWVLENGTHPVRQDDVGKVGLRVTATDGAARTFTAVRLREKAHYATAVALPAGTYRVHAVQGIIAPYALGTLTVPGTLKGDPLPRHVRALDGRYVPDHWGDIRPPGFASVGGGRVRIDADAMRP